MMEASTIGMHVAIGPEPWRGPSPGVSGHQRERERRERGGPINPPSHTMFACNLPYGYNPAEFKTLVTSYGAVVYISDRIREKGYAHVCYFDIRGAEAAVAWLPHCDFGRQVSTDFAPDMIGPRHHTARVFGYCVAAPTNEAYGQFLAYVSQFGDLRGLQLVPAVTGHYMVAEFCDFRAAAACYGTSGEVQIGGQVYSVKRCDSEFPPLPPEAAFPSPYPQSPPAGSFAPPYPQAYPASAAGPAFGYAQAPEAPGLGLPPTNAAYPSFATISPSPGGMQAAPQTGGNVVPAAPPRPVATSQALSRPAVASPAAPAPTVAAMAPPPPSPAPAAAAGAPPGDSLLETLARLRAKLTHEVR